MWIALSFFFLTSGLASASSSDTTVLSQTGGVDISAVSATPPPGLDATSLASLSNSLLTVDQSSIRSAFSTRFAPASSSSSRLDRALRTIRPRSSSSESLSESDGPPRANRETRGAAGAASAADGRGASLSSESESESDESSEPFLALPGFCRPASDPESESSDSSSLSDSLDSDAPPRTKKDMV